VAGGVGLGRVRGGDEAVVGGLRASPGAGGLDGVGGRGGEPTFVDGFFCGEQNKKKTLVGGVRCGGIETAHHTTSPLSKH